MAKHIKLCTLPSSQRKGYTLPGGRIDAEFFFMAMTLHIKVSYVRQMMYSKLMT